MHLVQLLLPVDSVGEARSSCYRALRDELTARFGGLTAYTRAPAEGLWRPEGGGASRDDIVILEVVTPTLDRAWWTALRERLERDLAQQEIHLRAIAIEKL